MVPFSWRIGACVRRRHGLTAILLSAFLMVVSGCVYFSKHTLPGACLSDLASPIRNFCIVSPEVLWRGERPTSADAKWLLENRVGSIVSLQLNDSHAFEDVSLNPEFSHSVPYFQVPGFSALSMVSRQHVDEHVALFLAIMESAPKPVYVHCRAGVDRTGVVAAAYRVIMERADPEEAILEMGRYHSPWQKIDARYVRGLTEARRVKILREAADWRSRLRPSAQIDCSTGRCAFVRNNANPTVKASSIP
jgi:protein tyrosine/serine phosphatase